MERAQHVATHDRLLGHAGRLEGVFRGNGQKRIEAGIQRIDAIEVLSCRLNRGNVFPGYHALELGGGEESDVGLGQNRNSRSDAEWDDVECIM